MKRVKSKDEVNDSEIPKFTPEARSKALYKIRQRMPTDAKKYAAVLTSLINTTPEKGRPLVKQYHLFHKKARFRFSWRKHAKYEREKEKKEKQKAHGPHRSPEKTVQINYIITLIKKEEKNNNFMITYCFFIWILTQGCFVPKLVEIG